MKSIWLVFLDFFCNSKMISGVLIINEIVNLK
jgi:hypothetical protein